MIKPLPILLGACLIAAAAAEGLGANPLQTNLRVLRERAAKKPAAARRAARPARRHAPNRRAASARSAAPAPAPPKAAPVSYGDERFGSKPKGGDLVVRTEDPQGVTHVYIRQRLLSNNGNGQARVPDLAPGKVPVLIWSPEAGKRRTYWVTIRPGKVASLNARL